MSYLLITTFCFLLAASLAWLIGRLRRMYPGAFADTRMERIRGDFWRYTLFTVLLLPLVFVLAYQAFGLFASIAVWLVFLIGRKVFELWRWRVWGGLIANFSWLLGMGLGAAALHLRDPFYLQMVPVLVAGGVAVHEALRPLAGGRDRSRPVLEMDTGEEAEAGKDAEAARTPAFRPLFMVLLFATAALFYEYLRREVSLDTWIWVFAFVRVELVLAAVGGLMPFGVYVGWKKAKAYDPPPEA